MKILMINVVCGIRSTGRICTDLAVALERLGHKVKIAYGREYVPEQFKKYAVKIGSDLDVKFHGLKARLFDKAGFGSKNATVNFIKWIKEYDPDVIHLHNIHGYYINIEILFDYLKTYNKKVIWTLHDCWSFTGHTAYCDAVNCERWITGCNHCPLLKEYPASLIDRSHHNWLQKRIIFSGVSNMNIITPSEWLRRLVKKSFLHNYPVRVIHNGIDTSQFRPIESDFRKQYGLNETFVLLGVAASWEKMKGYSDYLKVADLLGEEFKVVLVGLTKKQLKDLPSNILGIARTANIKKLAEIYTAADLFLNLSYCENYPTVNLESIACGTPVLTYRTGGSPEIIDEYGGIIVEQGDVSAVVEEIHKMHLKRRKKQRVDIKIMDNKEVVQYYLNECYLKTENSSNGKR